MEDSHFLRTVFVGLSGIIDRLENAKQAEIKNKSLLSYEISAFIGFWSQ